MVIQHNLAAMNASRQYNINSGKNTKIAEKLSSGYKINRAADDAAGLAMSEKMRRQVRGLGQAADNIDEGIGYVQTAEGALNEVHDMLQRMNELAVKSANGTNTPQDREFIDAEVQQLKSEIDRIFSSTSFNDRLIWEPKEEDRRQIGTIDKQAAAFTGDESIFLDITNKNCDVLAYNGYKINADEDGVSVSWKGYDGKDYATKKIDWTTLEQNGYSFEMSDYFDKDDANQAALFDNGNPVFKKQISFTAQEIDYIEDPEEKKKAEKEAIIKAINGSVMSSSTSVTMSGGFEDASGNPATNTMSVVNIEADYNAAYVSNAKATDGRNFDAADDAYLEAKVASGKGNLTTSPQATTVADAKNSTEKWKFAFEMEGIGSVTAESVSIEYWAPSDLNADDRTYWWDWYDIDYGNGRIEREQRAKVWSVGTGTLGDVMKVLTGTKEQTPPSGLLTPANGGDAEYGGYIRINFNLTADQAYSSGAVTSGRAVGKFDLLFHVDNTDTEETVLQKINDALNDNTILDFASPSQSSDGSNINRAVEQTSIISTPVWGGKCKFWVQSGTEAGQHIDIEYEALTTHYLKLNDVEVKTESGCNDAIDKIKSAIIEVSKQRSDFGAYQNRLEKAYNVNKNTQENTQASESGIRDTDMAKLMVDYSCYNILVQAGQSIMAQMNNSNQSVLQLLQ